MINFIICDDDPKYRKLVDQSITTCMMKNQIDYEVHMYSDYDEAFMKLVCSKIPFKIYILDIETPTRSGIDIARIIRNKDVDSIIIFLTGHQELSQIVIKNEFLFLTFINKFDNCQQRLKSAINTALRMIKVRKTIKFKDSNIIYTIALDDILYVTRDSVSRKCIMKTDYSEFKLNKTLTEIEKMLGDNFIKTHRACIVNKTRVSSYNKPKRVITFDNGDSVNLVSANFKEELR